jgi:Cu(I)/Ag(I) efflux system membrane protein CusA/SilA
VIRRAAAKTLTILVALSLLGVSVWPARQLGTEFMPSLNEGTLMYMPTTLPAFRSPRRRAPADAGPDHQVVSGSRLGLRQGRARRDRDRSGADRDVRDHHQSQTKGGMAPGVTVDGLIAEMDKALQFPGVSNAWTMPIRAHRHARDRHPHAGRRQGFRHRPSRDGKACPQIERVSSGARHVVSAYAERVIGGYYLDIVPDRRAGTIWLDRSRMSRHGVCRPRLAARQSPRR